MSSYLRINNGDCWNICCVFCLGLWISQPLVLCLSPGSGLDPHPQTPALASNLYLLALAPKLYLPALAPNLPLNVLARNFNLPALGRNLYLSTLAPNYFCTDPCQSRAGACIYQPCRLNLYLLALGYDLHYRVLNFPLLFNCCSSSGSGNISNSSNFFGLINANISMPILVN